MMDKNDLAKIIKFFFIMAIIFIVILGVIGIRTSRIHENQLTNHIEGSFETLNTMSDTEYLVFTNEHEYILYRQFDLIEQGTYDAENAVNARIYTLRNADNEITGNVILYGKTLYYIKKNSTDVVNMKKFSDTPTYINLDDCGSSD